MKKSLLIVSILLILLLGTILVACDDSQPNVVNYYLNSDGNLIAVCDDGTENNLGVWAENIIDSFSSITTNNGYYVIDGVQTEISEILPISYYLDNNLNLIAKYANDTIKNFGLFRSQLIDSINTISVNNDGYYVINEINSTIKAINSYNVKFNTGFNKSLQPIKVLEGQTVNKPELIRKGYNLLNWRCNDEIWSFINNRVYNDIELDAEWQAKEFVVSFNNEKGVSPSEMHIEFDSDVTLPTLEGVIGYTFDGWYYNDTKISSGKWSIDSDVTLNAKWIRDTYTISFDTDGGSSQDSIIVNSYSTIEVLPIPVREDYEFLGWYLGDNLISSPYDFEEGNIILKAHWKGVNERFEFSDDDNKTGIKIILYKLDENNVCIPNTIAGKPVTTIATGAFVGKTNLEVLDFGNNTVNFEYKCVENCNNLKEIKIIGDAVTKLVYMFGDNTKIPNTLTTITFKENSTTFGDEIFKGVSGHFFVVNVNAKVTTAPKDAFYECDVISEIYFSDTITTFANRVVCSCSHLSYVKLPANLQSVGMNNFMNCAIEYIIYPKSLVRSDYGGLCSTGIILVEAESRPSGWSSSAFTINEENMPIFYGFESLNQTDDFLYALCKVGSTKQCIIIKRYTAVDYPEYIDGYPVTYISH